MLNVQGREVVFDNRVYVTGGDMDRKTPLTESPADDFFTDRLDQALLAGEVDAAVHSAKDVPNRLREGLSLLALTRSLDETDALVAGCPLGELPPASRIGTSSQLRRREILSLRPDLRLVDIRGNIEERIAMVDRGEVDGIIVATCAVKRLGLESRIAETLTYETTPLQGQLAVVGRVNDRRMRELFQPINVRDAYGKVYLIGAGPGDPELATLKAVRMLESADAVFYDYLIPRGLLEFAPRAQKIYVGKRKGRHSISQSRLNTMIRRVAQEGKCVARLKGGDPLIFGRGGDELGYLRSYHIPVNVVPGVSSATGVPSLLGIPLTARGISSSVAFVSAHSTEEGGGHSRSLSVPDTRTIVFLMGLTKVPQICDALRKAHWPPETPVLVASKASTAQVRIVAGTLRDIRKKVDKADLQAPALIIVGETVSFWRPGQRSKGRLLYVGTNPEKYRQWGEPVHLPVIAIRPRYIPEREKADMLKAFEKADAVLLTSRFAVMHFFAIMDNICAGWKTAWQKIWAVIGRDTADELRAHDVDPRLVAERETSPGLLESLAAHMEPRGKRILYPRSSLPNPFLKTQLEEKGAVVHEFAVYENVKPSKRETDFSDVDKILFTSPSTVRNFLQDYGPIPGQWTILCKGPLTRQALREAGYESEVLNSE